MASASNVPAAMSLGWVKFFDVQRGFGSVLDVTRGDDVFVHYSNLRRDSRGWRSLRRGEYVQFLRVAAARGPAAVEVTGIAGGPLLCEAEGVDSPTFYDRTAWCAEPRFTPAFSPCPAWSGR